MAEEPVDERPAPTVERVTPVNPFAVADPTDAELKAIRRQMTKRIAIWGIGTGVLMALLALACLALILAAQNSG